MKELSLLIACSGPGAQEVILQAKVIGYSYLALTVILTTFLALLTIRSPKVKLQLILSILFLCLHPVFFVNPYAGDCGDRLRNLSTIWALASAFVLIWANGKVWRSGAPSPD